MVFYPQYSYHKSLRQPHRARIACGGTPALKEWYLHRSNDTERDEEGVTIIDPLCTNCQRALPDCRLTPKGGEHGNDLLFPAHHTGQKQGVVLGYHTKGLMDNLVVTHINQLRTFLQYIGKHEDNH